MPTNKTKITKTDILEVKVDQLQEDVTEIRDRLDGIDTRLDQMDNKLDKILDVVSDKQASLHHRIKSLEHHTTHPPTFAVSL